MKVVDIMTKKEPEPSIGDCIKAIEEQFAALCYLADKSPQVFRMGKIEFEGKSFGVLAYLRLIERHIEFIKAVVRERK